MSRRRLLAPALVATALVATACSSDGSRATTSSSRSSSSTSSAGRSTSTTAAPDPHRARFRLTELAAVRAPTAMAVRAGDDTLFVTEQAGRVRAIRNGALDPNPVIDLRDTIASGGERGLLGLAFSPDGATLYVDFTDTNGDTRVAAYPMNADGTADPTAGRELLAIAQPEPNHNGGNLQTGPDGMLWIGTGDGGAADDVGPGHVAGGNGQSLDTLLGKLLRIDPEPTATAAYSSRRTTRSPPAGADPRSGRTDCATRGSSASTPTPARWSSVTSGRTSTRRSTGCPRPPRHR